MRAVVTAVCGAGGKTTWIHKEAERLRAEGKKVLIATTTHMMTEPYTVLSGNAEEIRARLLKDGICMAGLPVPEEPEKTGALPGAVLNEILEAADAVLVEADGARHLPLKFPRAGEPVIPASADGIVVIMGLHGLGKRAEEVIHRFPLASEKLGIDRDDIVDEAMILRLLNEGYQKPLSERYPGKEISCYLSEEVLLPDGAAERRYRKI